MVSRIAITGATGFVGRQVVRRLASRGHELQGIGRDPASLATVAGLACQHVLSDWRAGSEELKIALAGCKAVIHLADNPNRRAEQLSTSEDLARSLAPAARAAGVDGLIFASSVYATEAEKGTLSAYGQGKLSAERRFQEEPGLHALILRLPPVYGPGSKGAIALIARLVRRGIPLPFGAAKALRDYLHVENLTALVAHLVELPRSKLAHLSASIHEPSDDAPISTADLVGEIGRASGTKVRLVSVPKAVLAVGASVIGRREQVEAAFRPLVTLDQSELERLTGWKPCADWRANLRYLRHELT